MIKMCILGLISLFGSGEMEFVNQQSGFVVVEQREGKVIFHDPIVEADMKEIGVAIPREARSRYEGREYVKLGEDGFFEAFREFYSVYIYDPDVYQWQLKYDHNHC